MILKLFYYMYSEGSFVPLAGACCNLIVPHIIMTATLALTAHLRYLRVINYYEHLTSILGATLR